MEGLSTLLIPFLGTTFGATMVFFMKNSINKKANNLLLGFASGIMIAASIWSLIMPSIEMAEEQGRISWVPASIGFLLGIIFLLLIDIIMPILNKNDNEKSLSKTKKMVLAVTIHNIPEGMAVGVALAGALMKTSGITMTAALALSIGIAVQNFPEGAIVSMPLKSEGMPKIKAFIYGMLSGLVEPIGALITVLLTNLIVPLLPYLLSFASGAMIYVVVEELVPEFHEENKISLGVIGVALGFVIMMILDVQLG